MNGVKLHFWPKHFYHKNIFDNYTHHLFLKGDKYTYVYGCFNI